MTFCCAESNNASFLILPLSDADFRISINYLTVCWRSPVLLLALAGVIFCARFLRMNGSERNELKAAQWLTGCTSIFVFNTYVLNSSENACSIRIWTSVSLTEFKCVKMIWVFESCSETAPLMTSSFYLTYVKRPRQMSMLCLTCELR